MKKILLVAAIFALGVGLVGCSKQSSNTDNADSATLDQDQTVNVPPVPPEPTE